MMTLLWPAPPRPVPDPRPVAYFLVGAPGTGKTTWRHAFMSCIDRATVVISSDDVIERRMLYNGLDYETAFRMTDHDDLARSLREEMAYAVLQGHDIIVDRTNMRRASRLPWRQILDKRYLSVAVVFSVRPTDLRERLRQREEDTGKYIPFAVVQAMLADYEQPRPREFERIHVP